MVARFSYMKDYKTLIRALLRLDNNVHLLCIGDGPFLMIIKIMLTRWVLVLVYTSWD